MTDELMQMLEPAVQAVGLDLFDVELKSGVLLVTVDRAGGVDLEALTDANRAVSAVLDERDPLPGSYTLEVSSPGVERNLRTPRHFVQAVGETVSVKTRPHVPGDRRLTGELLAADDDGFDLAVPPGPSGGKASGRAKGAASGPPADGAPGRVRLAYSDIDRARTVFTWGPTARPGGKAGAEAGRTTPSTTTPTEQRKQVPTS